MVRLMSVLIYSILASSSLGGILDDIADGGGGIVDDIADGGGGVIDDISGGIDDAGGVLDDTLDAITQAVNDGVASIKSEAAAAFEEVAKEFNDLRGKIENITGGESFSITDALDSPLFNTPLFKTLLPLAPEVNTPLMLCLYDISPDFKTVVNGLNDISSDLSRIAEQYFSLLFDPIKCEVCGSQIPEQCAGCELGIRRLNEDFQHAVRTYGPGKNQRGANEDSKYSTEDKIHRRRDLLSVCPSHANYTVPNYSTVKDAQYSSFLEALSLPNFPSFKLGDDPQCLDREYTAIAKHNNDGVYDERTSQNAVTSVLTVQLLFDGLIRVLDPICELIPENLCGVVCITNPLKAVCWLMVSAGNVFGTAFEFLNAAIELHDGVIDGAEIQATLQNTENLIDWTCSMEQHINNKFTALEDTTRGSIQSATASLTEVIELRFDTIKEDLDIRLSTIEEGINDILALLSTTEIPLIVPPSGASLRYPDTKFGIKISIMCLSIIAVF